MSVRQEGSTRIGWLLSVFGVAICGALIVCGQSIERVSNLEKRMAEEIAFARKAHADFQQGISMNSQSIASLQAQALAIQKEIADILQRKGNP